MGHCEWFYIIRGLSVYKACIDFPLTWSYRKQNDIPLSIPCSCHLMVWVRLSIPFYLGVSGARKRVLWYSCVKFTSMDGWSRGRELHKLAHKAAWPFAISLCLGSLDSPPLLPISSSWWSLDRENSFPQTPLWWYVPPLQTESAAIIQQFQWSRAVS